MIESKQIINLVLVEDELVYSKMILYQLSKLEINGFHLSVNHVGSLTELLELSEFIVPDLVLLDLGLPETNGEETFNRVHQVYPGSAIIILTGHEDHDFATSLVQKGAQDYIVKVDVNQIILGRTLSYTLGRFSNLKKLSDASSLYRSVFMAAPVPIMLYDLERKIIFDFNTALKELDNSNELTEQALELENQLANFSQELLAGHGSFDMSFYISERKLNAKATVLNQKVLMVALTIG
jgi:CheY-like chemotaxis protein